MQRDKPHNKSPYLGLLCTVFGHDYILIRKTPENASKYQCAWCEKKAIHQSVEGTHPESSKIKKIQKILPSLF